MNEQQLNKTWEGLSVTSKNNLIMLVKQMMEQEMDDMIEMEFDKKKYMIMRLK